MSATQNDAATPTPIHLDGRDELDALVVERPLVLVMFYTNGCGKCHAQEPVLGNVARATEATVAQVNARDTLDLVRERSFRGVPTLLLYRDGEVVEQLFDFRGTEELVELIESYPA